MNNESKLLRTLFIIQIISSLLIVIGHYTAAVLQHSSPFWVLALNQISRYGTVLLTIVTGYITAYTLEVKKPGPWEFFSGKIFYIFIPYIFAGVLYHYLLTDRLPTTAIEYVNILFGKTGGHLYFIFMLFQYYLFVYLFRNVITKKNILPLIGVFLIVQYLFINHLYQGWFDLSTRHFLPTWIFTFYTGHLFYWYRRPIISMLQKKQSILILLTAVSVLSAILFVLSDTMYVAVHLTFVLATLISFLVMIIFFMEIIDLIRIRFLKGVTFYIYLFHSAFIIIFNHVLVNYIDDISVIYENAWFSMFYLILIYASTVLFSLGVAFLLKRLHKAKKERATLRS